MRNLGFTFDKGLNMRAQISKVKQKAIGNLVNIARIVKYLDRGSRLKLVYGLVLSHIDFCNSLYIYLPNYILRELQLIINSSARLIVGMPRFSRDPVSPACIELHFLPVKARIIYKICLLTFKSLTFGQPIYLAELLNIRQISRDLRSSSDLRLDEPIIAQSNFSNRCFEYVAPRLYNSLPVAVRDSSTVFTFKRRLKTFLFNQAYDLNLLCLDKNFRM